MSHVSIRMLVGWEDENLEGARHHSQTISLLLLLSSLIFFVRYNAYLPIYYLPRYAG